MEEIGSLHSQRTRTLHPWLSGFDGAMRRQSLRLCARRVSLWRVTRHVTRVHQALAARRPERLGARRASLARLMVLSVTIAMLLGGCQGAARPTVTMAPDSQQIFHTQMSGISDIATVDPAITTDVYSLSVVSLVFPSLLVLDPRLAVEPWAADGMPAMSSDGLTYTFKVKRGLKWSDGAPITSETFAYAINRAESPCVASPAANYLYALRDASEYNTVSTCSHGVVTGKITTLINDSILTPDAQTLVLKLARPAAYFLEAMTYPTSFAVPEKLIKQYPTDWTKRLAGGNGFGGNLYKITRWNHAGNLTLDRNDAFWGAKPTLREISITFYKDTTKAYSSYQAGADDIGVAPTAVLTQAEKHAGFHQIGLQAVDYYAMNWKMAPFDDVRVRQAFAIALDKRALASSVLHGAAQATNHIVPDGAPGYNPNLVGPDATQRLTGDTAMANRFATAYATDKQCGSSTDFSRCPPVTLTIYSGVPDVANEALAAQQMWARAFPHWRITITSVDFNTLMADLNARTVQLWASSWSEDYPDPQNWLSLNLACDALYNDGNACIPAANALIHGADANANTPERLAQYQQAEQMLVTQVGWLPLDQPTAWWEVRPWVVNFSVAASGLTPLDTWQTMYIARR